MLGEINSRTFMAASFATALSMATGGHASSLSLLGSESLGGKLGPNTIPYTYTRKSFADMGYGTWRLLWIGEMCC